MHFVASLAAATIFIIREIAMNNLYKRIVTIGMICFTAVLAWIYCVLEYRTEPVYIIGVSLILVISLYALLNAYIGLRMERENKLRNYIDSAVATTAAKLEHGQDNTDLECLSKAIYVQLRKSNTILMQMMETDNTQSAQNMETYSRLNEEMNKLIADSINKAVKIIVKYNQNNHDGMVSALSDLSTGLERIGHEINQTKTEIANFKIDIPAPQETEPVSTTDASTDAPDLNSFFNEFDKTDTTEISNNTEQAATEESSHKLSQDEIAALFTASKEERKATSDDDFQIHEHPEAMSQDLIDALLAGNEDNVENAENISSAENSDDADIIPFPAKETTVENDDSNRQLTPDEIAALFASAVGAAADAEETNTNDADTDEISTGSTASKATEEPVLNADTEPESAAQPSPVNEDPNRQLTPEEIAALFASVQ